MNSGTVLAGTEGATSITRGKLLIIAIGTMSRMKLKLSFSAIRPRLGGFGRLNPSQTTVDAPARLGRCSDAHGQYRPSSRTRTSVPPDPTHKAHFCDRHHIASEAAGLVCCSSIVNVTFDGSS